VVLHTVKIQKRRAAACKFQRVLLQGLFHQCAVMHRTPAGIRFDDSFRPAASGHPHRRGFAVLCETPAALEEDALRALWQLHRQGAKLQVAEQYWLYPTLAKRLAAAMRQ